MACSRCDDTGWRPVDRDGVRSVERCDCWRDTITAQLALHFGDEKNLNGLIPLCRLDKFERNVDPLAERDWSGRMVFLIKGQLKVDSPDGGMDILVGGYDRALLPVLSEGRRPARTGVPASVLDGNRTGPALPPSRACGWT